MKRSIYILFVSLVFTFCVDAQVEGVGSEYIKSGKNTRVYTNLLYLVNKPEQFVEIQFEAWYKGETLTTPPGKVTLTLYSFSKKPVFAKGSSTLVIANESGEQKIGTITEVILKGTTLKGVDTFFPEDGNPDIGIQIPLANTAAVRVDGKVDGLIMEMMSLTMKAEQFMQFAKSSKIEMRIGTVSLPLNDLHVQITHRFADRITPPPAP